MPFLDQERARDLHPTDMERMRIGSLYWGATLTQVPETCLCRRALEGKILPRLPELIRDGVGWLFWGDFRGGKTSLAVILMKEVAARNGTALFLRAPELGQLYFGHGPIFSQAEGVTLRERAESVDLLVLDDVGSEHGNEWATRSLERIIRFRREAQRSLCVTTNFSPKNLAKIIGSATAAVLRGCAFGIEIEGTGFADVERRQLFEAMGEEFSP